MAMFPKGFFRIKGPKPKPKRFTPRPKLYRVAKKNAAKNKGYKKFWPSL